MKISEEHFKKSAKRLKSKLLTVGTELSYNQCLQMLSQSLYSKPYEEIKATLFENTESDNFVVVLKYGSEKILTLNGEYVSQLNIGTEIEETENALFSTAESLAIQHGTSVKTVDIPEILGDEWDTHEVIDLAEKMGYFQHKTTIFDLLEDHDNHILINGSKNYYRMDGDFVDEMINCYDDDPLGTIVWHPELFNSEGEKLEFYISFEELCNATTKDGKQWIINSVDPEPILVSFLY